MKRIFKSTMLAMVVGGAVALSSSSAMAQYGGGQQKQAQKQEQTKEQRGQEKKAGVEKAQVGQPAPAFELKDTAGNTVRLSDFKGKVVVLEWFNPECPFVVKHHELHPTMLNLYNAHKDQGVVWLAINSGAPGKQGAGLELNQKFKTEWKIPYPILLDESGTVGRAFGAERTPHMMIINKDGVLVYRGAIDDNRSARELGQVNFVAKALEQLLKGETITTPETTAYGCTVKY